MNPSARPHRHRFWRLARLYFRRFRIAVWLLLLLLVAALLYLNQLGLPNFVKQPLLDKLHARGLDLQFSRLRLRWYEGIVAENVHFGRAEEPLSPKLTLRELQVRLNPRALLHFQLQVDGVILRQGRLTWPLGPTNQPPNDLSIDNIQSDLRFLPDDLWALDNFKASIAGVDVRLSGIVTNASAIRDWKFLQTGKPVRAAGGLWQDRLRRFADTLQRVHFAAPPELRLDLHGDARDLQTFGVLLMVAAPGADTPWGAVSQGRFTARLFPADTNGLARAELNLVATAAKTPWADITNLNLGLRLASLDPQTNLVRGALLLTAGQTQTRWGSGAKLHLDAQWVHSLTNPIPLAGHSRLLADQLKLQWGDANHVEFLVGFSTPPAADLPPIDNSWAGWTNLQPYALDWDCRLTGVHSPNLQLESLSAGGDWHAPRLSVTNLVATLSQGHVTAHAALDVGTRLLNGSAASDLDPQQVMPLLTDAGRRWLQQFTLAGTPQVQADISLILPAWTNRQPDWRTEVQPTLKLAGQFNVPAGGAYRRVPVSSARSHFIYTNLCWHLPDLIVTRPEGGLAAEHHADERTKDFSWRFASTLDPHILQPLLEPAQQRVFDYFAFTQPPYVQAEVWGRFHEPARTAVKARVAMTNFSFRGEAVAGVQASLHYTNQILQVVEPRVQYGTQQVSADGLLADFNAQLIYLTNGVSTAEPMAVARAIGPHIVRAIESYQFLHAPVAHVHGVIPLRGEAGADLHFDIDGGPFHWWRFNVPRVTGQVHWVGELLTLRDVRTAFYGGSAAGWADFNFTPRQAAEFRFALSITNALLQALMADLSTHSNHLEGWLSGALLVTNASTADWHSACGYGNVALREGVIWDIPVFGIFSPILNGIAPGLGNSRATAATGSFGLLNGVIRSPDLEIRAAAVRLQYRGSVDLDSKVNARVEAELLRDMWLVGPLVSTVFWPVTKMFEYKVTGTLGEPKTDPVFLIPKLMLLPFHPFRTLKGLIPEDFTTRTNTPSFSPP